MKSNFTSTLLLGICVFALGCQKQKFVSVVPLPQVPQNKPLVAEEVNAVFSMQSTSQSFEQEELEQNNSHLTFQIKKADSSLVGNLNPNDFQIFENNQPVPNFTLTKNSTQDAQTADIIFVVDVTGSMTSTIEAAKIKLINFVQKTRQTGYHTRMCLVTFGDYTVSQCNHFYNNDPKDPSTEAEVTTLISEITKLKALKGSADPGGTDLAENPMRALIDASKAPWQSNNQRFAILMTDADFLYSPGHSGKVGALAPKYEEIKQAIADSQMKIFAATPSLAGYDLNFKGQPGVVQLSQGEWFKYADLVSGKITFDSILNRILININTTFVADYVVEEQPDLNPALPLTKRNISIQLKDPTLGTVTSLQLKSNLPDGRKDYATEFKLTDKKINLTSVQVLIDNVVTTDYQVNANGVLVFKKAPHKKAKIDIKYLLLDPKDSLVVRPLTIPATTDDTSIEVYLNSVLAKKSDYTVIAIDSKTKTLQLSDEIYALTDPYQIIANKQLDVKIKYKKPSAE